MVAVDAGNDSSTVGILERCNLYRCSLGFKAAGKYRFDFGCSCSPSKGYPFASFDLADAGSERLSKAIRSFAVGLFV